MIALNLLPLPESKSSATLVVANKATSDFAKTVRYIMLAGLHRYVSEKKDAYTEGALEKVGSLKNQAWSRLSKAFLTETSFPKSLINKDYGYDDIATVYMKSILRWYKHSIENNPDIPASEKLLFRKARTLLQKGSSSTKSGLYGLSKAAWALDDWMGTTVDRVVHRSTLDDKDEVDNSSDIDGYQTSIKAVVKKLTGKSSLVIPADKMRVLRSNTKLKDSLSEYRRLKRALKEIYDASFRRITNSGPIPSKDAVSKLKAMGFEEVKLISEKDGFDGLVGFNKGKLELYSPEGEVLNGVIAPGSKVTKNPSYDPENPTSYIYQYVAPNGVATNRISVRKTALANAEKKFKRVDNYEGKIKSWLGTWKRDLFNVDESKRIPAAIAYLLYMTGARVGSSTSNRAVKSGTQSYGISSLLAKHVRVNANTISITYTGKKGVSQKHVLKLSSKHAKQLGKILKDQKDRRKSNQTLWTITKSNGEPKPIGYSFVNRYIKSMGLQKIHSLRHLRGNELVRQALQKSPFKLSAKAKKSLVAKQKAADEYIKFKVLTPAANLLGHKTTTKTGTKALWRTTVTSYIKPDIIAEWYLNQQLEVPKWVPKSTGV